MKGTVGNKGKNIPITPSKTETKPTKINKPLNNTMTSFSYNQNTRLSKHASWSAKPNFLIYSPK